MFVQTFKSVIGFFSRNHRRLIILALFSTLLYGTLFFIAYVTDPEKTVQDFSKRFGIIINFLLFLFDTVATHYILIFHVFLPLMHKKQKRRALATACLLYVVKLGINYSIFWTGQPEPQVLEETSKTVISESSVYWFLLWNGGVFFLFDLVVSFSAALMVEWIHKSKQQIILEKQKAEAELSALKHQINPHFLFNSLSFIYSKIMRVDEETADSVLILADIMRYALGEKENADGRV